MLLKAGVSPNTKDEFGRTPLCLATSLRPAAKKEGNHIGIILALLQAGAKLETKGSYGRTALHNAAFDGDTEAVAILLDGGAKIDTLDNHGHTPISLAARRSDNTETIVILAKSSADIDAQK